MSRYDKRPRNDRDPDERYFRTVMEEDARLQPDPELKLSGGGATIAQIWLITLGTLLVLGVVFYGMSQTSKEPQTAAAPPAAQSGSPAPSTTGSGPAPESAQPAGEGAPRN